MDVIIASFNSFCQKLMLNMGTSRTIQKSDGCSGTVLKHFLALMIYIEMFMNEKGKLG
jgi:hypothetical protein